MTDRVLPSFLNAAPVAALPGTWKLARGRAVTLHPVTDGIVRVAHGRMWATVEGPHGRTPDDSGDHVLQVGRSMFVKRGQRLVLEAWNASGASYFAWDPVFAAAPTAQARRLDLAGVVQPLADLRLALLLGVRALGQLAAGIVRLAWDLAAVRPIKSSASTRAAGVP